MANLAPQDKSPHVMRTRSAKRCQAIERMNLMKDSDEATDVGKKGTTEAYLRAVTVGERKPLNGSVCLAPYDPDWRKQFSLHARQIRDALSEGVLLLEHVGSTSVPGLWAKPIIDMVLAVSNSADEPSYVPALEARGFVLRIREPDWFQHRLLKAPDIAGNLHVFSIGCEEVDRMLMFRDWLRTHDDDRRLYEETKRTLAAQTWEIGRASCRERV